MSLTLGLVSWDDEYRVTHGHIKWVCGLVNMPVPKRSDGFTTESD